VELIDGRIARDEPITAGVEPAPSALPALPVLSSLRHQRWQTLFALDLLRIQPKITDCIAVGF